MPESPAARSPLANFIARHWLAVIIFWVLLVAGLRLFAPRWDDVTRDGDLAYLPAEMPSVRGEKLLAQAFPENRSRSQIAIIIARNDEPFTNADYSVALDVARRFKNLFGVRLLTEAAEAGDKKQEVLEKAQAAFDEAIKFDKFLNTYWDKHPEIDPALRPKPLAEALWNRSLVYQQLDDTEQAAVDREAAKKLSPELATDASLPLPQTGANLPVMDIWTWRDKVLGSKLGAKHKHARVMVLQLSNEFMATDNIRVLEIVEEQLAEVRQLLSDEQREKLTIRYSGSAAVGGDMQSAAKESIKNTELFTILLVVVILGLVYRSPLLVVLPLVTIAVSLMAATSIVAMLTQVNLLPGFDWWEFKIFTTTKIFIVVILFGAGTDYFLFLVSRYREEVEKGGTGEEAVANALAAVSDALVASAMTTILGLSMMFFADFGKFQYSGPVIGLCLAVTLAACMTLAPALLRALGKAVFWPRSGRKPQDDKEETAPSKQPVFWTRLANGITAKPGLILIVCIAALSPLAGIGVFSADHVTYDLLSQLPADRQSKQGAALMKQHFPIGESGPIVVVAHKNGGDFTIKEELWEIQKLAYQLFDVDGITTVRSLDDPLGDYPPDKQRGPRQQTVLNMARAHPAVRRTFISQGGEFPNEVTRFELLLEHDPFSPKAAEVLSRVDQRLKEVSEEKDSYWQGATFAYAGVTAGIRDLREVTRSDNIRIELLVVLAVFVVLLVILRRPVVCVYLILSVLFSYYVTIGATETFFSWVYGEAFVGLDWKTPLFLFVILVAIGQDYNVYLTTRVFEEQQRLGLLEGLRTAVVRTGGIITSCGVIMAGTFVAMTSGTWRQVLPEGIAIIDQLLPAGGALPSIVQLGFALSLGVMLDTFIVRTVLVPAFLALLCRRKTDNEVEVG